MKSARPTEAEAGAAGNGAPIFSGETDISKTISSLRARAALVGHVVHQLADDGYIVVSTKWAGMARHCPDLAALASFVALLEGRL